MLSCSPRLDPQLMTPDSEVSPPVALSHIFRLANCKLSISMAESKKNQQPASSSPKEPPKSLKQLENSKQQPTQKNSTESQIRHCFKVSVCPPRRCLLANPRVAEFWGSKVSPPLSKDRRAQFLNMVTPLNKAFTI